MDFNSQTEKKLTTPIFNKKSEKFEHDIISMKDSELNDEILREKQRRERIGYIIAVICQFFSALNQLQLKTYAKWFKGPYSQCSLLFYRSVMSTTISYFIVRKKGQTFPSLFEVKHKFWFLVREAGAYVILALYLEMTYHFRVSTCQCIFGCHPIFVLFLSIFVIGEHFYVRYLVGIITSFIGSLLILSNEVKPEQRVTSDDNNMLTGYISAGLYLFFISFSKMGQKIITKDKMSGEIQTFFLGLFSLIQGLFLMICEWHFGIDIKYILYCLSNGILFYIVNVTTAMALQNIAFSKFLPFNYLATVFIFIFGWIILGEHVYFTDILGSMVILGFPLYNEWVPISKRF